MNPEIKALWLESLRSGEYVQGTGTLRSENDEYCCLGVLCDLASKAGVGSWAKDNAYVTTESEQFGVLPGEVQEWAGMETSTGLLFESMTLNVPGPYGDDYVVNTLIDLNDNGMDFASIADVIEDQF
jgi:hypothetical protein